VFTGKVDQISGWLDPVSRTTEVRVVVANPGHRLKPNMFAKARLASRAATPPVTGIALPAAPCRTSKGRASVFVEELTVGTVRSARGSHRAPA
jgi:cobalt-zinc-cadmium efflux system membrane fusion protein